MSGAAVERYAHVYDRSLHNYVMVPQEDGDWVQSEDHDAAIAALAAELQQCREALQSQYDSLTRELERIHAVLKAPGDKPHLMTVWTHLNSMHNAARAALKERT